MWLIWEPLKAVKVSQKEIPIVQLGLKENDHFKIHNSQVPAIYSWEKLSELLFIKKRRESS